MKRSLMVASGVVIAGLAWSALGSSNEKSQVEVTQVSGDVDATPLVPLVYSGRLRNEDANRVADLRRAGVQGDASQIPALLQALESPTHVTYAYTSLHALAQLGALDALDAVSKIQNGPDEDLKHFAQVSRARLLAEGKTQQTADRKTQIADKAQRFYTELGLTPADVNAGVLAYISPKTTAEGYTTISSDSGPTPVPVYAIREVADMIYRDSLTPGVYKDYADLPEVTAVDFSKDYASALKVRLAPLSHNERITILITELANKRVLRMEDDYELQLAINEGTSAIPAIAAKLNFMASHRDEYSNIGFAALFRVLGGIGLPSSASLIGSFLHDKDNSVAYYADQNYRDIGRGIKHERISAY